VTTTLRGMTWSHPRGYDPMVATSAAWLEKTGVRIEWDKRSLQDFETFPVEQLARQYDLIVIDHPHVGQITAERCLLPLDVAGREAERADLGIGSVGQSYASYAWDGHQWAFPIDAATQVQAYRPESMAGPLANWDEVRQFAREGLLLLPLRPPHSLMAFFTLAGNLGHPCSTSGPGDLIAASQGERVIGMLQDMVSMLDPACFDMDPIAVLEAMSESGSLILASPLIYGYVSYAADGFRPYRLAFADIPLAGEHGPVGSALGGTGIAVSAFTKHPDAAVDFAYWVASGPTQRTLYASSGGQPGHASARRDPAVNAPVHNFYVDTRETLEGAWVRPRHNGYMAFQDAASQRLNAGLLSNEPATAIVAAINRLYRESF